MFGAITAGYIHLGLQQRRAPEPLRILLETAMPPMYSVPESSAELPILIDVQTATGTGRIAVFGDLERATARSFEQRVIHLLAEQRPDRLELDLAGVLFLDSGGIRSLLRCREDAQQRGCRLTLVNVQPFVRRVLSCVDLLEPFSVPV